MTDHVHDDERRVSALALHEGILASGGLTDVKTLDWARRRAAYGRALTDAFETGRRFLAIITVEVALTDDEWNEDTLQENLPDYIVSGLDKQEHDQFEHFPDPAYMLDAADTCTTVHPVIDGTEMVVFFWTRHADCHDCGRPAAFYREWKNGDRHTMCSVCAANAAVDGETIHRIEGTLD